MSISRSPIGLPLENALRNQIYNALQGDTLEYIIKEAKIERTSNYWRHILEGHSFKVDREMSGKLFDTFHSVKESLGFTDKVDFYVTSSAEVNAFAVSSYEKDEPHIINLHSSMLDLMSEEELRFVIGHEIGHLISQNAYLFKLINFVFPENSNMPSLLSHKIRLWKQLSELIADRYGYIACPDLNVCISAFFKMSSGLDTRAVDLDINAFLQENNKRLEYFKQDQGLNIASHPINPVRVRAINLFADSEFFNKEKISNKHVLNESELQKEMDELINILLKIKSSELDYHITHFIASAGLVVAGIDGDIHEQEIELLTQSLSDFMIFPGSFLENLLKSGKINDIFNDSLKNILEINPGERQAMLSFMINMVMADKKIAKDELDFIFHVGQNAFGYSKKEIAQFFANIIQHRFVPSIHDLS